MRLTSTGLTIGTTSPAFGLTVQKDNGSGYVAAFRASAGNPYITFQTTGSITQIQGINAGFTDVNNIAMQLSGGNVGIATSSPSTALDVATSNSGITLTNTAVSNKKWRLGGSSASSFVITETGIADRLTIDTSGNVGIGTNTPAYKLDVNGTINSTGIATLQIVKSKSGNTGSVTTGVATTLFALVGDYEESYIVNASVHAADTANYFAVSIVVNSDTARSITALRTVGLMTISLSGGNVQATQISGGNATIYWNATRLS
jgi:hypothetical protein